MAVRMALHLVVAKMRVRYNWGYCSEITRTVRHSSWRRDVGRSHTIRHGSWLWRYTLTRYAIHKSIDLLLRNSVLILPLSRLSIHVLRIG